MSPKKENAVCRIACLHTAESNIAVFDDARRDTGLNGVDLHHSVRADLLATAEREGRLTPAIEARTIEALRALCNGADVVLLTCSTLGPAAEAAGKGVSIPIMRVDAALAAEAVKDGGHVVALCAVETTMEPTRLVFEAAARSRGATVTVQLVPVAWEAFRSGNRDRYLAIIADAARQATRDGAARVALAQASMADACALIPLGERPLSSPAVGLLAAIAAAS